MCSTTSACLSARTTSTDCSARRHGKSTLLYLISGLLRKEQGTITIDGIETDRHDPAVLSEIFLVPEGVLS